MMSMRYAKNRPAMLEYQVTANYAEWFDTDGNFHD